MKKKDETKLSTFDVIDYLCDGEAVILFLALAIAEGDEDCIAKCIKDVARGYDKIKGENKKLKKQLDIATKALKKINKDYRHTVAQDIVYEGLEKMKGRE